MPVQSFAFGSDWPIDDFDEWYDLKVAATRRGHPVNGQPAPRLGTDRDLTVTEVLRAATIDSAYAQHRKIFSAPSNQQTGRYDRAGSQCVSDTC